MHRLGLRTKFFLYSNTLIVVTMALVTIFAVYHERNASFEAVRDRALGLAHNLALPVAGDLASLSDRAVIRERIRGQDSDLRSRHPGFLLYVVVAEVSGEILYSSPQGLWTGRFERALGPEAVDAAPQVETRESGPMGPVLEVLAPLETAGHPRGSLAMGFSMKEVEQRGSRIARHAGLFALALLLGNSALTAIYVETLIRPILHLNQSIKRAGRGDLSVRATTSRGDEVGELSRAFNRMMDELEEAREMEQTRQSQLAHTEKMAAVGSLAAGVAHEVNNPLGGILTCIESMREHPDDVEMHERYLQLIHDGLKRIEHIVANLLDFSRQRQMVLEPTSLNHSLRHVIDLVKFQLERGSVAVEMDLDADEPLVMADHFQMEQLFLNLVLNALQSMPDGGTLSLRTRRRHDSVVVEVRDSGAGIPEEIRDRIFDPFFTTREVGEGTGLGLAVSDSIVAAHGGMIEVESSVGKGTVFRVAFPALERVVGEDIT
jgi:signal transduction histidine kinase